MTFKQELQAQRECSAAKFGPDRLAITEIETAALAPIIDARDHPRVGDKAPNFVLPDALAKPVDLSNRLDNGPVVLNFYRGGWCPYCNIELRAYQALLPRIAKLGASLMAISPQAPDDALTTAEKNALTFDVLSDRGSAIAERYGLDFELSEKLKEIYIDIGNDLTMRNAADDWRLPVPATFVIAADGTIAFAHVEADYRERADPDEVIDTLERLGNSAA
jgi:peroxiredoxin